MSAQPALSAVLIVKNEEKNIEACLRSVAFAGEAVVVDSGSTDHTMELARAHAAKVVSRPFDDFSSQKNFAVSQASGEWVFSIDADERVPEELRDEILRVAADPGSAAAFAVRRRTNLFGRVFRASGLQDDAPVRLFRRGKGVFVNPVHEVVRVDGRIGRLKHPLDHRSFQTLGEYWAKLQHYTEVEARQSVGSFPRGRFRTFFGRPFYRFFSIYVLKQGFRDGFEGWVYAVLSGYYEWLRWMKRWEVSEGKAGK